MEDNDDDGNWGPDYVANEHKPWLEKVENALYFSNPSNPDRDKRIQCKTWSWYHRFWEVMNHFYGAVFAPPFIQDTILLLVNDVLGPGHLPMPTTGDRGFTWYEYMHAMVESTGWVPHPSHMGMTIICLRSHLRADGEFATEADEFLKTSNTKCSQLGTPLVELLSEAGRWFGYWNCKTKKFTDGFGFPSEMTALEVLRFLEKKAGFERIPIRTEYEAEEPGFWGRVKRVETRWSYHLESNLNDYVYVPSGRLGGRDYDRPYKEEPKVPIVKRLSMMLFLQHINFDEVEAAMNDADMDSEIDDGAVVNENDNEAVDDE
jgi:hypothetical protein